MVGVQYEIDREQNQADGQHVGKNLHGPEEVDPVQKSQKQRRIAQRCEGAAGVGHQKNEEHHHEGSVAAIGVGAQKGADEQHGRAGGAHPGRQHGADHQNGRIDHRGASQSSPQQNPARDRVKRPQQNNEWNIVGQDDMQDLVHGDTLERDHKRNAQAGGPEARDFSEMVVPEIRQDQRHEGDRQQHARKGDAAPDRKQFSEVGRRRVSVGCRCGGRGSGSR